MVWTEIEETAISQVMQLLTDAGFVNGDKTNKYQEIDAVPYFRGFLENPDYMKIDHLNYDVVPVNDATYSDNEKSSAYLTIAIDYVTSSKRTAKRVNDLRKKLEMAFDGSAWSVYYTGYDVDTDHGKTAFSYSVRRVFFLK